MSIAITEHILMAYDIIGDVHGYSEMLECLLANMGYQRRSGTWSHASRTAVFVGDFIDRGPGQIETLRIVRDMIDGGHAFAVMGNHELNAIGYWTPHPTKKGTFLRARNEKNEHQHGAFLRAVNLDSALHGEWVNWFMSLPLWLDLGDIRVIHACWYEPSIQMVQAILGGNLLKPEFAHAAFEKGHQNTHARDGSPPTGGGALFHALENLLKGIEIDLPADLPFTDKGGLSRTSARTKWWLGEGATLDKGLFFPEEFEHLLPVEHLPSTVVPGHDGGSPLFVGHYWLTGTPETLSGKVACVDYSVANGGPLAAYRWDGEQVLTSRNFVTSD